ncbi:ECF transporter S component [Clostridium sp. Marseille-Q2269]|uniref:ECF transporter S component n=1 Tax=Clostridium sp. Marseille-Q2269 TaxID=2942205 RepID=UPI002073724E|nr:ECF transporter S component [Clostridium sp. Marseille-Q2269]
MEQKKVMHNSNILDIVHVAIMAAIICVVTFTIKVPTYAGYTHLGDSMVLLSVVLLGRKKGVFSSAIGMAMADIISGYLVWAPFTILIKGLMAFIAGTIIYKDKEKQENLSVKLLGFILAGIWMVVAYYLAGAIITRFIMVESATLSQALLISLKDIPSNIAQAVVGIIIALPLGRALKRSSLMKSIN